MAQKQNIVVSLFKVESEAYQALTELKQTPGSENSYVAAACLVKFRASSPAARDFPASLLAMERLLFIALLQRIADPMQLN